MKKMCDHPAGVLFAVLTALLIVILNYSTRGSMGKALVLAVAIILFYIFFCLLCKKKENNESDKDL